MVLFQKLTNNLFLTLHRHNVHRQQWQLSKFLMRYQQFASHAYCGAAGPVSKMASQQEKATPSLRWIWLPCRCVSCYPGCTHWRVVINAWETRTVAAADGVGCARVRWEMNFLLTFETHNYFVYTLYYVFRYSAILSLFCILSQFLTSFFFLIPYLQAVSPFQILCDPFYIFLEFFLFFSLFYAFFLIYKYLCQNCTLKLGWLMLQFLYWCSWHSIQFSWSFLIFYYTSFHYLSHFFL